MTFRQGRATDISGTSAADKPASLLGSRGLSILHWCGSLLGGEPIRVHAIDGGSDGVTCLSFQFPNDGALQITRFPVCDSHGGVRLTVAAERGRAEIVWPSRVSWSQSQNCHSQTLPPDKPIGQILLEQFDTAIREGRSPKPDLHDAHGVLRWLRAARQSRFDGRWVDISP